VLNQHGGRAGAQRSDGMKEFAAVFSIFITSNDEPCVQKQIKNK